MIRIALCLLTLISFCGCGPSVRMNSEPVSVSGKLSKGGAPIGGVLLTLQPIEVGHPLPMKVGADGSFSGQAVPGKYVYFVSSSEADPAAIEKVDAKYKEANMERFVTVKADQTTYDIALD